MTRAPTTLLAVRNLLITHLNIDKDRTRDADLEPAEVGIVGDPNHRGGYHCGSDRVVSNDYSVVESPRDRAGLTLDAAALDVGQFRVTSAGRTHDLRSFSVWCVGQCTANAPDTRDIREIIYSPDGRTVRRWDRLRRRSSGDDSHLWHTHFSFFRDAIKAGRDQTPLFRRYLASIGLTSTSTGGVDELFCKQGDQGPAVRALQVRLKNLGFNLGKAGVDGSYGPSTTAALKAACKAANPKTEADGTAYDHNTMFYVDMLMARRYGGGQPGPQGPKGDPGSPGANGVTLPDVLGEIVRRLAP